MNEKRRNAQASSLQSVSDRRQTFAVYSDDDTYTPPDLSPPAYSYGPNSPPFLYNQFFVRPKH